MPAQRDLTGLRFGNLTVLRSDGRAVFGRDMMAWLCRCDCGAELRVPQRRLTTTTPSHQLHACEDCRALPCEICGKPVPRAANSKTCSPECRAEKKRRYQLGWYHAVRATDAEDAAKRQARSRARRAALSPEEKLADSRKRKASEDRATINARARARYRDRVEKDPEYAAKKQASRQRWASENKEKSVEYTRAYARKKRARQAEIDLLQAADKLKGHLDE